MMTQAKNTDNFINEYIKAHPPYHSTENLGVNVADILKYANKCEKKVKDLSEYEVKKFLNK